MSLRDLDFADGIEPSVAPDNGTLQASALQVYASDAAFVTAKGSAAANGDIYINSTDNCIHHYVGGAWRVEVLMTASQVLTNKDIDGGTASDTSRITLPKASTGTLSGLTRKQGTLVYDTTLNKVFYDTGSALVEVGSGASGGGIAATPVQWKAVGPDAAAESYFEIVSNFNIPVFEFSRQGNYIYSSITVPDSYVAGTQILIKGGMGLTQLDANGVVQVSSRIMRMGATPAYSNAHSSATVSIAFDAGLLYRAIGDLDITDAVGVVGADAVAPGDVIILSMLVNSSASSENLDAPIYIFAECMYVDYSGT